MSEYRSRVRLSLTQRQAEMILRAIGYTDAGEVSQLYDAGEYHTFRRGWVILDEALDAAVEQDIKKGRG